MTIQLQEPVTKNIMAVHFKIFPWLVLKFVLGWSEESCVLLGVCVARTLWSVIQEGDGPEMEWVSYSGVCLG